MKPRLVPTTPQPPDIEVLLTALQGALSTPEGGDPGYTTEELAVKLGYHKERVRKLLLTLHAQGRLAVGKQYRRVLDGRVMPHAVYRLIGG